jgi:hypothetical protein
MLTIKQEEVNPCFIFSFENLKNYELEMFRTEGNASFQSLNCHAHLKEDICDTISHLNAVLGAWVLVNAHRRRKQSITGLYSFSVLRAARR